MNIAVMPGDGVGKEVVPEGLKVLKAAAEKFGFQFKTTDFPHGGEHYLKTKETLPDSALKELGQHDAILFGAVGVDPRGNGADPAGHHRDGNPAAGCGSSSISTSISARPSCCPACRRR